MSAPQTPVEGMFKAHDADVRRCVDAYLASLDADDRREARMWRMVAVSVCAVAVLAFEGVWLASKALERTHDLRARVARCEGFIEQERKR